MTYSPSVLLLNSAQSKYPRGDDPWIRATVRAFEYLTAPNICILTSTDPLMWDFTVYLASKLGKYIRYIVPDFDRNRAAETYHDSLSSFKIDETRAEPLFLDVPRSLSRADIWRCRDMLAIQSADQIYPISIRPGGRLASLLSNKSGTGSAIRDTFRIDWHAPNRRSNRYDFDAATINPFPAGDWLIHWTRTSPGPWPGESKYDFFTDMLARPSIYVRSARETLVRIVGDGVIRASDWKIPTKTPVVSLTENTPETAVTLMRWRKRFVRYTYEPYGVAIRRDALEATGARKVIYTTKAGEPGDIRWAVQSPGMVADWTRECEWRHPGNINLGCIDRNDWFAIVPAYSDAACLASRCGEHADRTFVLFDT